MNQPDLPRVTVIIPMLNEERYIEECIKSVIGQDYPLELLELLVVDGGSTDRSTDIVRNYSSNCSNVKLLGGMGINCPAGMNLGIVNSSGQIVCKVDSHGYIAPDFLKNCVDVFQKHSAVKCVGGPIVPIGENYVAEVNMLVRSSVFGVGRGVNTLSRQAGYVDTIQCGIYDRKVFDLVGLFDETMQFGEDEELNWRIIKAGYKIFSTPSIRFFYYARKSFQGLYRQYRNYGTARVKVLKKHPDFLKLKHLMPFLFVTVLVVSLVLAPWVEFSRLIFLFIVLSYSVSTLAVSLLISLKKGLKYFPALPISFACLHFGYGVGMLKGLPYLLKRKNG